MFDFVFVVDDRVSCEQACRSPAVCHVRWSLFYLGYQKTVWHILTVFSVITLVGFHLKLI